MTLFECSEESFDYDIIYRSSSAVHGYFNIIIFEYLRMLMAGILASLV